MVELMRQSKSQRKPDLYFWAVWDTQLLVQELGAFFITHYEHRFMKMHEVLATSTEQLRDWIAPVSAVLVDFSLDEPENDIRVLLVLREITSSLEIPLIALCPVASSLDQIVASTFGAYDTLSRPISPMSLEAKVRAFYRHFRNHAPGSPMPENHVDPESLHADPSTYATFLTRPPCTLDLRGRRLFYHGKIILLTQVECDILAYLMQHAGQICSKQELMRNLFAVEFDPGTHTLAVHIHRVRAKLKANGLGELVTTHRKKGYR